MNSATQRPSSQGLTQVKDSYSRTQLLQRLKDVPYLSASYWSLVDLLEGV